MPKNVTNLNVVFLNRTYINLSSIKNNNTFHNFLGWVENIQMKSPRCGCNSSSGLYSEGFTWSIVLRCDDYTGIFTCDGCAQDPYFYVPAETQSSAQGRSLTS